MFHVLTAHKLLHHKLIIQPLSPAYNLPYSKLPSKCVQTR